MLYVDKVRNIIVYIKLQSPQYIFLIFVTLIPSWIWEQKNLLSTPETRFCYCTLVLWPSLKCFG